MRKQTVVNALKGLVLLPALVLAAAAPKLPVQEDLELDEVLVNGQKPTRDPDKVTQWFVRLVGSFRMEGQVELPDGTTFRSAPVRGTATCNGIGGEQRNLHEAPGVECFLDVTWPQLRGPEAALPGGSSTLRPAVLLYGYNFAVIGVTHLLVDNQGVAEGGTGLLFGDTVVTATPCAHIEGNCRRRVRITAEPDLMSVRMRVEMQVDGKKTGGYEFVMYRESAPP